MLTDEVIQQLKEEHGEIFSAYLGDEEVVFRPLKYGEYKAVLAMTSSSSSVDAEEYLINCAVVWPDELDLDEFLIGEVAALSDEILEVSAFSSIDKCQQILDEAREMSQGIPSFMMSMVIAAGLPFDIGQLEDMSLKELAAKASIAENILNIKSSIAAGSEFKLEVRGEGQLESGEQLRSELTPEEYEAIARGEYHNPDKATTIGAASVKDPIAQQLQEALQKM